MTIETTTQLEDATLSDLIGLSEAADITGLRTRTLSAYVLAGTLPSLKIANARLFSRRAVEAWRRERDAKRRPRAVAETQPAAANAAMV